MEINGADPMDSVPDECAVRVTGVSKSFAGTRALDDVTFDIARGSIHALCGGNGSGKSTLIKVLAGVHQADAGTIAVGAERIEAARITPTWATQHGLHFVHQAVGTFPSMTVAENFAAASSFGSAAVAPIRWRRLHREVQLVLDRFDLGISSHTRMTELAPARQTMVAVARALREEDSERSGVLVLDEPTASLPPHEADQVMEAIRGYAARGLTVVFVTHRLGEIREVAQSATFLRDGGHLETRTLEGLTERDLIERIAGHVPVPAGRTDGGHGLPRLVLRNYGGGRGMSVDLTVDAGEIVGISGLLGSGRSSLLQALFGAQQPGSGSAELDGAELDARAPIEAIAKGVAYVPEDRAGQAAFAELTIRANLSAPRVGHYFTRGRFQHRAERRAAAEAIGRYGVVVASPDATFASMSGGNQQKVSIARWLDLKPRLLLLDEPTQGVDVGARAAIHNLVRDSAAAGCAVLVVSSDAQELAELCHRVVGLWRGRIVGEAHGAELSTQRCTELGYGLDAADVSPGSELST